MKLASLRSAARDGRLVVVSRDLQRMLPAEKIVGTLQAALDNWSRHEPALRALAATLETGDGARLIKSSAFRRCRAPISGPTARPMSITSNWCAGRVTPNFPPRSGQTP